METGGTFSFTARQEMASLCCCWSPTGHHMYIFFFSSRRRHTRLQGDWSSDVCRLSRPAGRGGIDDRLHTGGGGGHLGGRRCVSVGRAQLAAAHAAVVPCDSRRRYYGELTGRARNRCHILSSD